MTEEFSSFDFDQYVAVEIKKLEENLAIVKKAIQIHEDSISSKSPEKELQQWIYLVGDINEGFEALGPYNSFEACMDDNEDFSGCAMLLFPPTEHDAVDLRGSDGSFN